MTLKTLRLLVIALSCLAVNTRFCRGVEIQTAVADNWVPLPLESSEPPPVFLEPVPVEKAFPTGDVVPPLPAEPISPDLNLDSPPVTIEGEEESEDPFGRPYNAPGWYSHPEWSDLNWRSGNNGRFGEFSLAGVSVYPFDCFEGLSLTTGAGYHFLDGPSLSDMPPRLFEFSAGLHYFDEVYDGAWLDMGFSAGIYTDFEDSAREGWRFPTHAVFSWETITEIQPVVGVKYFDRDTLGLLPVAGVILRPDPDFRAELVFPEPSIAWKYSQDEGKQHWLSLSGRIGGGEWAIEREPSGLADVVTYNSYQLVLGLDTIDKSYEINSLEIGYSFERNLDYRSGSGNFDPAETIFVRLVTRR